MPPKDPNPVNIHLDTTADVKPVEEVNKALEKTVEVTNRVAEAESQRQGRGFGGQLDAQNSRDVAEAKREETVAIEDNIDALERELYTQRRNDVERAQAMKRAWEEVEAMNASVERLRREERWRAIGMQIRDLTAVVSDFSREFANTAEGEEALSGLSEGVQVFGSTAASVSAQAAAGFSVGGPIGGAIGGLTGLVRTLGGEWLSINERVRLSEAETQRALVASAIAMEERRRAATSKAIEERFAAERKELERQRQTLEHIAALRDAKGDLAAAQDRLSDQQAINAGANRDAITVGNVGQQLTADRQALAADLEKNRKELQLLANDAFNASNTYKAQVDATGKQSEEAQAALARMNALFEQVGTAEQNLRALEERLGVQEQTFATEAQAKLEEQKGRLLGSLTGSAEKLRADLEREIQEQGDKASTTAKSGLQDLVKILQDRMVTEDEVQQLAQVVARLESTQEAKDAAVAGGMEKIIENTATIISTLEPMLQKIRQQDIDLGKIRQQAETLRQPR